MTVYFSRCSKRILHCWLGCDKPSGLTLLLALRSAVAEKLGLSQPTNSMSIGHLWRMACILLGWWIVTWPIALWYWIFVNSWCCLDIRLSIPAGRRPNEARMTKCRKHIMLMDLEIWWSQRDLVMERAAAMENSRKLLCLIWSTGQKALDVSQTICKPGGSSIHYQQRRLVCRAEHFQAQFSLPSATASPVAAASVSTDLKLRRRFSSKFEP